MKKRIIALLLSVFMLSTFVGCSGDSNSSNGDKDGSTAVSSDEASKEEISIDVNEYINDDGTISMPDLKNMPIEQAKEVLKKLGLKYKVTEDYCDDSIDVGCVIETDYLPGESIKKGKSVFITVRKEGTKMDPNVPYVDPLVESRGELKQGANSDYKPLNYEIMKAVASEQLDKINVEFYDKSACCVIMASKGYPEKYEKGYEITFSTDRENVFVAGAKLENGKLLTNGGRVLGVTAIANDLKTAIEKSYEKVQKITFGNAFYRKDIGQRALKAKVD